MAMREKSAVGEAIACSRRPVLIAGAESIAAT